MRPRTTLFPERTSGLIFFENMMGIFFTGRDLTSEVLAETGAGDPASWSPSSSTTRRRNAAGQDPGLRGGPAASPSGAVRRGRRGGLAKGDGPGQLHPRPDRPARTDHRSSRPGRNPIHRGLLFAGRCQGQDEAGSAIQFPSGPGHARRVPDPELDRRPGPRPDRRPEPRKEHPASHWPRPTACSKSTGHNWPRSCGPIERPWSARTWSRRASPRPRRKPESTC